MTEAIRTWLRGRSAREQRLLLVLAAVASIVLAWLLVIRPLGDALAEARERHDAAVIAKSETRARAEAIGSLEKRKAPALLEPVDTVLAKAAAEAGFELASIEPAPDGSGTTIAIEAVKPQAFFPWAAQLEGQRGLLVTGLSATANADRTLAVRATFRAKGG
jgi:general secretion pathway protein M